MKYLITAYILLIGFSAQSQNITGVWHGKITKKSGLTGINKSYKIEVKFIAYGDSIKGTAYYYNSKTNYYRYAIKGYRDGRDNSVHWWDDTLIESKMPSVTLRAANDEAFIVDADYNCPGGDKMYLDGPATKANDNEPKFTFSGEKVKNNIFNDEWDWVIDNFYLGAAEKDIIDSVAAIAYQPKTNNSSTNSSINNQERNNPPRMVAIPSQPANKLDPVTNSPKPIITTTTTVEKPLPVTAKETSITANNTDSTKNNTALISNPFYKGNTNNNTNATIPIPTPQQPANNPTPNTVLVPIDSLRSYVANKPNNDSTKNITKVVAPTPTKTATTLPSITTVINNNQQKLQTRKVAEVANIPITSDSIELNFYDNGIVDGDSIAIFLNDSLLHEHVFLSHINYKLMLPVALLKEQNTLVMVAENLGSIPPNTSTVIIYVGKQRYQAELESDEKQSATIKFYKPSKAAKEIPPTKLKGT
jgi:hypothetical protein